MIAKNKKKREGMTVWNVPKKLKADFKAACAALNIPMNTAIREFMEHKIQTAARKK